jgi:hypothetical protein
MKARLSKFLLLPLLALGPAWGCASGQGAGGDTATDGQDVGTDVTPDGEDVPADADPDVVEDGLPDAGGATTFYLETSGGALMTSPTHRLELFIGPVRPVGSSTSETYVLELGPAGARSH